VFKPPKRCTIDDTRFSHYIGEQGNAIANNMELIMIVIPNNKTGDLYSMVKKKCTVEAGVPSQVVTSTVLVKERGIMAIATKIAIQMQAKLGGEP
jgi:aubergine